MINLHTSHTKFNIALAINVYVESWPGWDLNRCMHLTVVGRHRACITIAYKRYPSLCLHIMAASGRHIYSDREVYAIHHSLTVSEWSTKA